MPAHCTPTALQETEKRLEVELFRSAKLQVKVSQLEAESDASASSIAALTEAERELTDKTRDQVSLLIL